LGIPALNAQLANLLLAAYLPCPAFVGRCAEMRWAPASGQIPRGFCGAAGHLKQVELVLICAEPGDPHTTEHHCGSSPEEVLQSAYAYAYHCFRSGKDLFHRNIRYILDLCWPGTTLDTQLQRTWIVDSVLCSARVEGGSVTRRVERECRRRYLEPQLALMPQALVVALGAKAYQRTAGINGVLRAYAAAPPGCNRQEARPSWSQVAEVLRERIG
jgi:hypothetical protein